MYIIVNYDRFWKHDRAYSCFLDAFMRYELFGDDTNVIEYYGDNYERQVVWSKEMFNF